MIEAHCPSVSVIVPTRGRPELLEGCLRSLAALDHPRPRLEVIVVEDGPSPRPITERVIARSAELVEVTWIRQDHAGPAAARNRGAAAASGALLAFTDDDCRVDPAWLRRLVDRAVNAPESLHGGHTVNALRDNIYATTSQLLIDYIYDYNLRCGRPFFASNNLLLASDLWRRAGGFSTRHTRAGGEDRGLCDRYLRRGLELVYVPDAVVWHHHDLTLPKFVRQHLNYGRGALVYHHAREERVSLEPLAFYLGMLRYARTSNTERPFSSTLLLGLSQVANAIGFFAEALDHHTDPR